VSEDSQAFLPTGILTDQDGNVVWYEILMNRDVFAYIRDAGLARTGAYSFGGPLGERAAVDFPTARDGASGAGTISIKAAWREMTDADDTSRYFTQEAVTYDGTDCLEITVGLVGLHIARKVASSPKWIWATFENEDNVLVSGTDGDGRAYFFFSQLCAADPPPDCWQQVGIVYTDDICCPNLIPYPSPDPTDSINQVTRLIPIQAAQDLNRRFRQAYAKAGSPFQYFLLVGAQWAKPRQEPMEWAKPRQGRMAWSRFGGEGMARAFPSRLRSDPYVRSSKWREGGPAWQRPCNPNGPWAVRPPAPGEPCYEQIPEFLRNTSMETLFVQTDGTGTQRVADSCMNCHFAGGVDGSYLWLDAMLNPYALSDD
jgi:hypothetical protein